MNKNVDLKTISQCLNRAKEIDESAEFNGVIDVVPELTRVAIASLACGSVSIQAWDRENAPFPGSKWEDNVSTSIGERLCHEAYQVLYRYYRLCDKVDDDYRQELVDLGNRIYWAGLGDRLAFGNIIKEQTEFLAENPDVNCIFQYVKRA